MIAFPTALAGCATYAPQPIDPMLSASSLEARTLDAPPVLDFITAMSPALGANARRGAWSPAALALAALYYHPDLEIDRATIDEAAAGEVTASQWSNPTVTLSPTEHTSPLDPSWTVGAAISLLVETFGKRAARQDAAAAAAEAARHDLAVSSWHVRSGVETALIALSTAESKATVAAERRALQMQLVGLTEQRQRNDAASGTDVAHEQAALGSFELSMTTASSEIDAARQGLASAIGVPQAAVARIEPQPEDDETRSAEPELQIGELRHAALTNRSDVLGALSRYQVAESALRLELARQFPDLSLGPSYAYQEQDNEYVFSATAELPILNQNQGPIGQAEAKRRGAAAQVLAVQARVLDEVEAAFNGWRAAARTLAAADALSVTEDRERERVEQSFKAGQADHLALIAARLDATTEELAHIDAVAGQRRAKEVLETALQQPVFDPLSNGFMDAVQATRSARS